MTVKISTSVILAVY